jgi:lipopolysaccharide transport protein LptA
MSNSRVILKGLIAISSIVLVTWCPLNSTAGEPGGNSIGGLATVQGGTAGPGAAKHASKGKSAHTGRAKQAPKSSTDDTGSPFTAGSGPINIRSDTLQLDYKNNAVVFSGHVRAIQSGSELTTDVLHVNYEKNFKEVKDMVADGNVRISQGGRWATSDHAVMNQKSQTVVMTGNPVAHDGQDQITGTKITTYLQTGKSVVESANAMIFSKQSNSPDNVNVDAPAGGPDDTPPPEDEIHGMAPAESN